MFLPISGCWSTVHVWRWVGFIIYEACNRPRNGVTISLIRDELQQQHHQQHDGRQVMLGRRGAKSLHPLHLDNTSLLMSCSTWPWLPVNVTVHQRRATNARGKPDVWRRPDEIHGVITGAFIGGLKGSGPPSPSFWTWGVQRKHRAQVN